MISFLYVSQHLTHLNYISLYLWIMWILIIEITDADFFVMQTCYSQNKDFWSPKSYFSSIIQNMYTHAFVNNITQNGQTDWLSKIISGSLVWQVITMRAAGISHQSQLKFNAWAGDGQMDILTSMTAIIPSYVCIKERRFLVRVHVTFFIIYNNSDTHGPTEQLLNILTLMH